MAAVSRFFSLPELRIHLGGHLDKKCDLSSFSRLDQLSRYVVGPLVFATIDVRLKDIVVIADAFRSRPDLACRTSTLTVRSPDLEDVRCRDVDRRKFFQDKCRDLAYVLRVLSQYGRLEKFEWLWESGWLENDAVPLAVWDALAMNAPSLKKLDIALSSADGACWAEPLDGQPATKDFLKRHPELQYLDLCCQTRFDLDDEDLPRLSAVSLDHSTSNAIPHLFSSTAARPVKALRLSRMPHLTVDTVFTLTATVASTLKYLHMDSSIFSFRANICGYPDLLRTLPGLVELRLGAESVCAFQLQHRLCEQDLVDFLKTLTDETAPALETVSFVDSRGKVLPSQRLDNLPRVPSALQQIAWDVAGTRYLYHIVEKSDTKSRAVLVGSSRVPTEGLWVKEAVMEHFDSEWPSTRLEDFATIFWSRPESTAGLRYWYAGTLKFIVSEKCMVNPEHLRPFLEEQESVFYAVFDSHQGPKIVHQVPEGLIATPISGSANSASASSFFSPSPVPNSASPAEDPASARAPSSALSSPLARLDSRPLLSSGPSPQKRGVSSNRFLFNFDDVSKYIIPPSALCGRLVKFATRKHRIIGFPVELRGKYERNYFRYNLCFVFDKKADLSCYEPVVRKASRVLTSCEEESAFLSAPQNSSAIYAILEQLYEDLNSYSETSIQIDKFNSIELKIFPFYPNPPPVKDWQVPLALIGLTKRIEPNWDLTVAKASILNPVRSISDRHQICPYIDGVNHVARIARLADCDLELTRQAISHLLYYQVIMMIDIFQYSNMYTLRKSVQWLADEAHVREECGPYVTRPEMDTPDWPKLLHLYSRMKSGATVLEWMQEHKVQELGVDVRRFTSFGVVKVGLLP
ncbi:hypothetical protein NM688_g8584 [Phlebia brevispora]|uniref:Uncharacterized protein n=1 Tax=Phlebia brevispora TaxID=194682 RepID=A0ACC1RSL6_9APHY|nr:hypothetical protein NM688_g8584 [Phlebia brevispora]